MERRAFLRGIGAAGGATLAAGLPRASAAARGRMSERLRQAGVEITARVSRFDGSAVTTGDLVVGAGGTARRAVGGGSLTVRAAAVADSAGRRRSARDLQGQGTPDRGGDQPSARVVGLVA